MKNYLLICFFLVSGMVFSQKKETVKMNRGQLSKINLLSELLKYPVKNSKSIYWEVVAKANGKLSMSENKSDKLSENAKSILRTADIGTKIYFDISLDGNKENKDKNNIQVFEVLVIE